MPLKDLVARREYGRQYYLEHKAESQVSSAKRYREHRTEIKAATDAFRRAHLERANAYTRKYKAQNPEKRYEWKHRYLAKRRAAICRPFTRAAIYARDRGICWLCHKKVALGDVSMDHMVPISMRGDHTPENVKLAHKSCNYSRQATIVPAQMTIHLEGA